MMIFDKIDYGRKTLKMYILHLGIRLIGRQTYTVTTSKNQE